MPRPQKILVEFLYFDQSHCLRCQMSEQSLEASLNHLKEAIQEVGLEVDLRKTPITYKKEARTKGFITSPTIKINGRDIEEILHGKPRQTKSYCGSCSTFCGEDTECRTFLYDGKTYQYIPRKMIVEAIKKLFPDTLNSKEEEK